MSRRPLKAVEAVTRAIFEEPKYWDADPIIRDYFGAWEPITRDNWPYMEVLYSALREEWIMRGRVTSRYRFLERLIREMKDQPRNVVFEALREHRIFTAPSLSFAFAETA